MFSDNIQKLKDQEKSNLEETRKGIADRFVETDEPMGFTGAGVSYGDVPPVLKASEYLKSAVGWVYACVMAIADAVAPNNIGLYKVNNNGDVEQVESHLALELLDRVNDFTTRYDHMSLTQQYLELTGEAPWYIDRGENGTGEPQTIMLLRPDCLSIVQSTDKKTSNPIAKYKYRIDAQNTIDIETSEMVFLKYPDPNNQFRGKGTLAGAARAYDLDNYAEDYNTSFFFNSGRPDMVIATDQKLTEKQQKNIRSDVNRMYKGKKNAHKTMILESGLEAKPFAVSQKDMEFLEQSRFSRDKILSIFRVHKSVIAITEDVNLANAKVGEYVFAKWTIKPKLTRIVAQLNEFYLPMFSGTEQMFFAFDDPVPADVDSKVKRYDSALAKGWMTLNEVRGEENLPDAGELGDRLLVPNSLTTLDRVGQSPLVPTGESLGFKVKGTFKKSFSRWEENGIKERSGGGYFKALSRLKQKQTLRAVRQEAKREIKESIRQIAKAEIKEAIIAKQKKKDVRAFDDYVDLFLKTASKQERYFITASQLIFGTQKEKILKRMGKKKVKKVEVDDYLLDEDEEAQIMIQIYEPLVKGVVKERGQRAANLVGTNFTMTTDAVKDYLKNRPFDFSFEMNKTTNDMLGKTLAEGVDAGEGIPELRKRVEELFDGMEKYRSERIARSEVIRASNFAATEAFDQSGVVDEVQWLATPDDRIDSECADLDGQTIKLGSSFASGVEYPPLHPNCRCTVVPVIK